MNGNNVVLDTNTLIFMSKGLIDEKAIEYRKNGPRKIKLPDAIILATTAHLNATLLTDDWDDFLDFDENIVIENLDDLRV